MGPVMNAMFHDPHPVRDVRLSETISALVSARHGMIRTLYEIPNPSDSPPIHVGFALMAPPRHFRQGIGNGMLMAETHPATGAAQTRTECLWATIGEAIERYAGSIYFDDELITASARELGSTAVPVEKFVLYGEEQYQDPTCQYARFDPDFKRRWSPGTHFLSGEQKWMPAQMIWLGYTLIDRREHLQQGVSTGLAAGQNTDDAIFGGLREMVERDAFVCHWLLKRPGQRIALSNAQMNRFPDGFKSLLNNEHAEITLRILDNEFSIPVVLAVSREKLTDKVALGAACHPDMALAIYKAVIEVWHTRQWSQSLEHRATEKLTMEAVKSFNDHVLFYRYPENFTYAEFLLGGDSEPVDLGELFHGSSRQGALDIAHTLAAHGFETYWHDITTADIASLGLHVVRVFVPGLQPLYCGPAPTDRKRLAQVAQRWGVSSETLNVFPHPFP